MLDGYASRDSNQLRSNLLRGIGLLAVITVYGTGSLSYDVPLSWEGLGRSYYNSQAVQLDAFTGRSSLP